METRHSKRQQDVERSMILLVRHIPTWGGRCEKITADGLFVLLKCSWGRYERHGKQSAAMLPLSISGAEAHNHGRSLIAALEALRHPKSNPQSAVDEESGLVRQSKPAGRRRYYPACDTFLEGPAQQRGAYRETRAH